MLFVSVIAILTFEAPADCLVVSADGALKSAAVPGGAWFVRSFGEPTLRSLDSDVVTDTDIVSTAGNVVAIRAPADALPGTSFVVDGAFGNPTVEVVDGALDDDEATPVISDLTIEHHAELRETGVVGAVGIGECGHVSVRSGAWVDQLDLSLAVDGTGTDFVFDVFLLGSTIASQLQTLDDDGRVTLTVNPGVVSPFVARVVVRDAETGLSSEAIDITEPIAPPAGGCLMMSCAASREVALLPFLILIARRRGTSPRPTGEI